MYGEEMGQEEGHGKGMSGGELSRNDKIDPRAMREALACMRGVLDQF
jgi:hypothetical protein